MNIFEIEQISLPIEGSEDRFPVNRVYCVGRNYAEHTKEMGGDHEREPPFYFIKSTDTLLANGGEVEYPPKTNNLQHEVELVVAIYKSGKDILQENALNHVFGYAVGIDLTRRDLQSEAKKLGRPWDTGKTFEQAAPITAIQPVIKIGHPNKGKIQLKVNSSIRQIGDISEMIWSVSAAIANLSTYFELVAGDLLFTGTPAGVGEILPGDNVMGEIEGVGALEINVI